MVAHVLGWYLKAIIFRNYGLLWTISIAFEVMEVLKIYSKKHVSKTPKKQLYPLEFPENLPPNSPFFSCFFASFCPISRSVGGTALFSIFSFAMPLVSTIKYKGVHTGIELNKVKFSPKFPIYG